MRNLAFLFLLVCFSCQSDRPSIVKPFEGEFSLQTQLINRVEVRHRNEKLNIVANSDSTLYITDSQGEEVHFRLANGTIFIYESVANLKGDSLTLTNYSDSGEIISIFIRSNKQVKAIEEQGNSNGRNGGTASSENKSTLDSKKYLKFDDVRIDLMDASLDKCVLILGKADKVGYLWIGESNKIAAIYKSKVMNEGMVMHLVLFLRSINGIQKPTVEEVYAIVDGERAYYGIHYVTVDGHKFVSNSSDFDY